MSSKLNIEQFLHELHKGLTKTLDAYTKKFEELEKASPPGKAKEVEKLKATGMPASEAFGISWKNYDKKNGKKPVKKDDVNTSGGMGSMDPVYGGGSSDINASMDKDEKPNAELTDKERSEKENASIKEELKLIRQKDPEAKGTLPHETSMTNTFEGDPASPLKKDDMHLPKPKMGLSMPKMAKLPKMPKMPQGPKGFADNEDKGMKKEELKPGTTLSAKFPSVNLASVGQKVPKPAQGVKTMAERIAAKVPMKKDEVKKDLTWSPSIPGKSPKSPWEGHPPAIPGQKSPPKLPGMGAKSMAKEEIGFTALKNKIAHQKDAKDAKKNAYSVGEKKYGKEAMAAKTAAGKKSSK